jgi:hypothetical protein
VGLMDVTGNGRPDAVILDRNGTVTVLKRIKP